MLPVSLGNKFQQTLRVYSNSLPNLTIITYLFYFVKSFFSGHKWTRTTDLTLIRRAL